MEGVTEQPFDFDSLSISEPELRLIQVGVSAIDEFLNTLKPRVIDKALATLPKLAGFNRGTDGEKRKQRSNLLNSVATARQMPHRDHYWRVYLYLWNSAGLEQFGERWKSQLAAYNLEDEETAARLIRGLIDTGADGPPASRESLSHILRLSPLKITDESLSLIRAATPQAEVERIHRLEQAPRRIDDLSQALRELETRLDRSHAASLVVEKNMISDLANLRSDIEAQKASRNDDAAAGEHKTEVTALQTRFTVMSGKIERLESFIEAQRAGFDSLIQSISTIDKVMARSTELSALKTTVDKLTTDLDELADRFRSAAPTVDDHKGATFETPLHQTERYTSSFERRVSTRVANDEDPILKWGACRSQLTSHLRNCGLSSRGASRIALQIIAALVVGQMCVFAGSMSEILALEIAEQFFGQTNFVITFSVGSFEPLRVIDLARDADSVVLFGLGRTPFDVVGGDLRRDILKFQAGWTRQLSRPMFGSYESGQASLPLSTQLLETGPFIDLDSQRWMSRFFAGAHDHRFHVLPELILDGINLVAGAESQMNLVDDDCGSLDLTPSPAWRIAADRYRQGLRYCIQQSGSDTDTDQQADEVEEAFDCAYLIPLLACQELDSVERLTRWQRFRGTGGTQDALAKAMFASRTFKSW